MKRPVEIGLGFRARGQVVRTFPILGPPDLSEHSDLISP